MSTSQAPETPKLPSEAISHLHQGRMIEAIKVVRETHGVQLKEAKDMVDAYVRSQPSLQRVMSARNAEAKGALLRWLFVAASLGVLAYFLAKSL
jgi:ribosomal protein L7/L12